MNRTKTACASWGETHEDTHSSEHSTSQGLNCVAETDSAVRTWLGVHRGLKEAREGVSQPLSGKGTAGAEAPREPPGRAGQRQDQTGAKGASEAGGSHWAEAWHEHTSGARVGADHSSGGGKSPGWRPGPGLGGRVETVRPEAQWL